MALSEQPRSALDTTSLPPLVSKLQAALRNESLPLSHRYRALFGLKHHACLDPPTDLTLPALNAIASAFSTKSALLKHELAYCLGQTRNLVAAPCLRAVLEDRGEDSMVRHESAEALGALGDAGSLDMLRQMGSDMEEVEVVRETCEIAVARIEWEISEERKRERIQKSDFSSIDPAPPLPQVDNDHSISTLQQTLLDTSLPLFLRYRAMFALRDLASPPSLPTSVPAIHALATGFSDPSALFRHEVAFVFGQLSHPASIPSLIKTLGDKKENPMVRHEAAEALGSLGDEEGVEDVLKRFVTDDVQVVRESVIVALDMAEFEKSGETEYAILPGIERQDVGVASA